MKIIIILFVFLITYDLIAGPPYDTDDPEPVPLHHWEVYLSSHFVSNNQQLVGTLPHFELNYGAAPNLQLHIIAPVAFSAVQNEKMNYGYSDTEIGCKFRFIQETDYCPQIGVFPIVELPTGNPDKGLGSGNLQVYLPLWFQKSFRKWTTYGGTGYWINPGKGNRNWQFFGLLVQYKILENISIGAEFYHVSANEDNGEAETRFNIGSVIDLSNTGHLLLSAGSSIKGSVKVQCYIGYQLTFGKD